MSKANFYIVYDGPALSGSQMDVEDLAPALLALRSLLHEANAEIYKSEMSIQLKVRATFQTGCFGIDLVAVQSVLKDFLSLFNGDEINGALNLLELLGLTGVAAVAGRKGLLSVIKWIRGRKIDKVTVHSDNMATIEIDGDLLEVEMKVIKLLQNQNIRQSVEKLIVKPLEREGMDSFATSKENAEDDEFIIITKEEIEYFKSPTVEDERIEEVEYEATYELIGPVFQEDNKWRMSDGESSFYGAHDGP